MSRKTLIILAVLLVVTVALVWRAGRTLPGQGEMAPRALVPNVDWNSLTVIRIADGVSTTTLERADGLWKVVEKDNYPADLARLRELVRALDEEQMLQRVDESADRLVEYGLSEDAEPAPLRLVFEHPRGTNRLTVGKTREPRRREDIWGPPAGRYVRVDEGPVLLIKDDLPSAEANPDRWWDRQLVAIPAQQIRRVEVEMDGDAVSIRREEDGRFSLDPPVEGQVVHTSSAQRLFDALQALQADDIVQLEEGAEDPFAAASRFRADTEEATYNLEIGAEQPEQGGARLVRIRITPETPKARQLRERIFRIPAYLAAPMLQRRGDLTRKEEEAAEETPSQEEGIREEPAEGTGGGENMESPAVEEAEPVVSEKAVEPAPVSDEPPTPESEQLRPPASDAPAESSAPASKRPRRGKGKSTAGKAESPEPSPTPGE